MARYPFLQVPVSTELEGTTAEKEEAHIQSKEAAAIRTEHLRSIKHLLEVEHLQSELADAQHQHQHQYQAAQEKPMEAGVTWGEEERGRERK